MTKQKVVITDYGYESLQWEEEMLAKLGADFIKCQCRTEEDLINATRDADAILVQFAYISREVIEQMKKCRGIVRYGVGLDCIDVAAATEHGIMVANIPDYGLENIADHTIALMLNCARKIEQLNKAVHAGNWDYKIAKPVYQLRDKTLGLAGFGNIARMTAAKARAFGMNIIAFDPYIDPVIADSCGVELVEWDALLTSADVLSLHVPVNDKTIHLMNDEAFSQLKNNCILINTARGALVDEAALAAALRTGRIFAAGLDVSEQEPIDPDSELLTLPNLVITPHSAWYTEEAQESLQQQAAQEIGRILAGDKPANLVNPSVIGKTME